MRISDWSSDVCSSDLGIRSGPSNGQIGIAPMQAGFVFGMVIVSTFVFDRSAVRQDTETVGKARGYPQLHGRRVKGRVRRIPRRRNSQYFPLSEGGRIAAQVDHPINDWAQIGRERCR